MALSLGLFLFVFVNQATALSPSYGIGTLNRTSFPRGFLFGTASSSYQYEGAAFEGGRRPSIWDTFAHKYPGKIADGSNGDVAIDSYHRYKDLIISVKHSCLGLEPFVTLFHWDTPQDLEDGYGGFLSVQIVDDFRDFVDICFTEFGDRVKHWITINEPHTYSYVGYAVGWFAPGRCSAWQQQNCTGGDSSIEPYLVGHNLLLAHAAAAKLYKEKYQASQKGKVGITNLCHWMVPFSHAKHHRRAAQRSLDFTCGWFMDPITKGDYPHIMRSLVGDRLPRFSKQQSKFLKGSFDFIGLNYYTAYYVADAPHSNTNKSYITDSLAKLLSERNGIPIGPKAASSWLNVYPRGILDLLLYIKEKYNNPLIYITENGVDEVNNDTLTLKEALADDMRVEYQHHHLCFLSQAIKDGANVRGYFAWSLMDNFEWFAGYTVRFGIIYIDYKNGLKRHRKLSAKWFKNFLKI
ncbi:hypothetical protein RJ639_038881 [Escallonia herrerae]|uniref:Beta-glucosidase n=1 Tax=Escallonia herrerae TaxID=1293975 RepID=A0AA88WM67_9ASTE|nr:hypothetical protein RJ639_038881 [Escallonia herrerae]